VETCNTVPDFAQIMRLLQEPDAYPHPVETVQLVQTHISCVFLTGEYVYKIKKPVDFGFLDYSTLSKRHLWCTQELLLNRRLCPDLYVDVLPITLEDGRLQIGGHGTPLEWAVRMKQLDEKEMLPQRLRAGALTVEEVQRLADRLAAFHLSASGGDAIRAYGAIASVASTVAITLETMDTVSRNAENALTRWHLRQHLEEFLEAHSELFARRVAGGHIRDCHGDLRTQNICLDPRYDNGIQIFDCIEFNDTFRYIDVAADIAYLAMDLELAGRTDLSSDLMAAYAHKTQDTSLEAILPFYKVYRAIVRGNIALLASCESEIPESERRNHREIAATAYDLALSYAQRRPRPSLLITMGFSGSGKSVLARELVRRLPAVHLSSDRLRKAAVGVSAATPLESRHYTPSGRAEVYRRMREYASAFLKRGQNVLLDATFLDPREREAAAALAREQDAEFWILECHAPDALIRQRLQDRHSDPGASDAGLCVYEQQRLDYAQSGWGIHPELAPHRHVYADTSQPAAETAHRILERFMAQSPVSRMEPDDECAKIH